MKLVKKDRMDYTVSCSQIQAKMRKLVGQHRFRASPGWLYGFLHKHKLSSRACTTAINKFNSSMQGNNDEDKRHSFFKYVKEIIHTHKIVCMWNMDETPLYLDMSMKRTIETKGKRCVPYLNTGNERKRVSVVLCVFRVWSEIASHAGCKRK